MRTSTRPRTSRRGAPEAGPFDADDLPDDGVKRVDLGALLVAPAEGRDLRVQVDEKSGKVRSVVLAGKDGAVELRAYAAPRNGDLWSEVRPQIAADAARARRHRDRARRTVRHRALLRDPGQDRRRQGRQPDVARGRLQRAAVAVAGDLPRPPGARPRRARRVGHAVTSVAVRRGAQAMPVGEQLPLTLPEDIRQAQADQAAAGDTGRAARSLRARRGDQEPIAAHDQPVGESRRGRGARPAAHLRRQRRRHDRGRAESHPGPAARHAAHGHLRPRGGVPALEAELYDGTGTLTLIWLGRRRIAGIGPGRAVEVSGRIGEHDGQRVLYNPRYELL